MLYESLDDTFKDSELMEFHLPKSNYLFAIIYYAINIIMIIVFGFIFQLPADTLEPRILPAMALIFHSLAILGISFPIITLSIFASIVNLILNGLLICNYLGLISLLRNFDFVRPLSIYFSPRLPINFNAINSYWAAYLFLTLMLALSTLSICFNWRIFDELKNFEKYQMDRSIKRNKKICSDANMKKILEGKSYELCPSEWKDVWTFNNIELSEYIWRELKNKDELRYFYSTREKSLKNKSKNISYDDLTIFLTLLWIEMKRLNIEILLNLLQRNISLENLTKLFKEIRKCLSTLEDLELGMDAWEKVSDEREIKLTRDDIKEMLKEIFETLVIEDGIKLFFIFIQKFKNYVWKVMLDNIVRIIIKKNVGELLDAYDIDISIENERSLVKRIQDKFKEDLSCLF